MVSCSSLAAIEMPKPKAVPVLHLLKCQRSNQNQTVELEEGQRVALLIDDPASVVAPQHGFVAR